MRTPARPRLPDGDCVFISDVRIVARVNAPGIAADIAQLGFAPRCTLVRISFSVSKLLINSSSETEKELMMDWVDRNTYMERLWALEGTRDIKVITGMRRSGKFELMKAFSASVARKDPSSNNVYINLLDLDNEPLLEYQRCIAKSWSGTKRAPATVSSSTRCSCARVSRKQLTAFTDVADGISTSRDRARSS